MDNHRTKIRIGHDDPRSKAASDTEQRLFSHSRQTIKYIETGDPDWRGRVLEVGKGNPLGMVPGGSGLPVGVLEL